MLNNGFAVLLAVLYILPNTTPFSSIAAVRSSTAYSSAAGIQEDNAIALERATFFDESRICSTGLVPGADGTTISAPVDRRPIGAHFRAIDPLTCPYVLRV